MNNWFADALEAPLGVMREQFEVWIFHSLAPVIYPSPQVNTLGVLALFKASYSLMKDSTSTPKFVPISSLAGSVEVDPELPVPNIPCVTYRFFLES
jgi:hypothetical protein